MPRVKYTYEDVKRIYEVNGNKLIDKQFNGVRENHEFLCGCGRNTHKMSFDNARRRGKVRCKQCSGESFSEYATGNPNFTKKKGPRLSIEDVRPVYEKAGVELLEEEFKGASEYHKYRCKCGVVVTKSTYNNFSRGKTHCTMCARKRIGEKNSKTHEEIISKINTYLKDGYTFIDYERGFDDNGYNVTYVTTICPKGHENSQRMSHITAGKGCKKCGHFYRAKERIDGNSDRIREELEHLGLELLSGYEGVKEPITYRCNCEDRTINRATLPVIRAGYRCGCRIDSTKYTTSDRLKNRTKQDIIEDTTLDKWAKFLRLVMKRDDCKCACCGKEGKLNIHHIWSTTKFPKLKTQSANTVTLLESCHRDFHKDKTTLEFKPQDSYEYIPNLHKFTGYTYEEAKSLFINKGLLSPDSDSE